MIIVSQNKRHYYPFESNGFYIAHNMQEEGLCSEETEAEVYPFALMANYTGDLLGGYQTLEQAKEAANAICWAYERGAEVYKL